MSAEGTVAWGSLSAQEVEQRLTALLTVHGSALTRLAASYVNATADRDDLVQDIVVAIWRALPRFRGECSERTFIFRIAHNRAIAYMPADHCIAPAPRSTTKLPVPASRSLW